MGGRVVLETALVAPERVRGLILLDSVLNGVEWDTASEQGMADAQRAATTDGMPAARAIWLRHPLFAPACRDAHWRDVSPRWSNRTGARSPDRQTPVWASHNVHISGRAMHISGGPVGGRLWRSARSD